MDAEMEKLMDALAPFARIWRVNKPLSPELGAGMRDYCAGAWPTIADCKAANSLLVKHRYDFHKSR